jgi:hypothetical protein
MKVCYECNISKSLECFYAHDTNSDGFEGLCKSCKQCRSKNRYQANKDKIKAQCKEYYLSNTEACKQIRKKWAKENRPRLRARDNRRRARSVLATPKWLTKQQKEEILNVYRTCPVGYEVDHITPLNGKNISGLNVPWNLQHLPKSENRVKGNKHDS